MQYRLMATYEGVPYHVSLGPDGTDATLFSPAPPPDELEFTAAGEHWRKQVSITDLGALWQSRLVGEYRGEPCLVLDDLGDRLHIAYRGRDSVRARQLGYWEIDREVFEVVVARQDIGDLTEERVEFPLGSAMFPSPHREPAGQGRPEAPGCGAPADSGWFPQAPGSAQAPGFAQAPVRARAAAAEPRTSPLRVVPRAAAPGRPSRTPDRVAAWHGSPESESWAAPGPRTRTRRGAGPWAAPEAPPPSGRHAGRRRERIPQSVFAELLGLAAIPHTAYAVDDDVPGAMCLVKAGGGFEVFTRTDDARLDVRFFEDEEAAYFYLFGVLAAEAVRNGRLRPGEPNGYVNGSRGPGVPSTAREDVSKYLRGRNCAKPGSHPAMVN